MVAYILVHFRVAKKVFGISFGNIPASRPIQNTLHVLKLPNAFAEPIFENKNLINYYD